MIVAFYTAIVTFALIRLVNMFTPVRVAETQETDGLDVSLHGEVSRYHDKSPYENDDNSDNPHNRKAA